MHLLPLDVPQLIQTGHFAVLDGNVVGLVGRGEVNDAAFSDGGDGGQVGEGVALLDVGRVVPDLLAELLAERLALDVA